MYSTGFPRLKMQVVDPSTIDLSVKLEFNYSLLFSPGDPNHNTLYEVYLICITVEYISY